MVGQATTFLSLIASAGLVAGLPAVSSQRWKPRDGSVDYLIIGGGAAGFVLAEELSRNPKVNVLLLEAGPDNIGVPTIDIPGYGGGNSYTPHMWNYTTEPSPTLNGAYTGIDQGRGYGGGTAVNYMGICRGAPSVFDEWAAVSGDDGLKWSNMYNVFKSYVRFTNLNYGYNTYVNTSAYGNGPLELTCPVDRAGFMDKIVPAWKNVLGLPQVDLNAGVGIGIHSSTNVIRSSNHTRQPSSQAFGWQLQGRPNAAMVHDAQVTKIIFSGSKAVGVNVINPNTNQTFSLSSKEIILSAGALNSPKLLMLSGVGPAATLKKFGIPLVADIAEIGAKLYDHYIAFMSFQVTQPVETLWQYTQNSTFTKIAQDLYFNHNGSGPLGVTNGAAFANYRLPNSTFPANDSFHRNLPADRPHLMFQYSTTQFQANTPNVSIASPFVSLLQPSSYGNVSIRSNSFRDAPLVYGNHYGAPGDKAAIIAGYKLLRKVVQDSNVNGLLVKEIYPGGNVTTDDQIYNAIAGGTISYHHPLGTIPLGSAIDGKTRRLRGLQGIRVVDSSTMPSPPACHPMGIVYGLALQAAANIKAQDGW